MKLNKVNISFLLGILEDGVETVLLNDPHTLAGDPEGYIALLGLGPEPLGLEIEIEGALCAQFGVGDIVADHSLASSYLTNL